MEDKKLENESTDTGRRTALKVIGGSALAVSISGLAACGGDSSSDNAAAEAESAMDSMSDAASDAMDNVSDAASDAMDNVQDAASEAMDNIEDAADDAMDAVEQAADDAMDAAEDAMDSMQSSMDDAVSGADLPRLDQSEPQAQALAYVNDATSIDASAQPRFQAGQACANCSLFLGGDDQWGPCSIFPGKAVNAGGWCSVYAPKA